MLHLLFVFLVATGTSAEDSLQRIRRASIVVGKDPAQAMHSIIDLADCQDLKKLCTHQKSTDNLSMLECALTFSSSQLEELPEPCQHELWLQQRQLQLPSWMENSFLPTYCPSEQSKLESCLNSVHLWSCLDQERLKLPQNNACHQHLRRGYESLGQDYSAVDEFYTACSSLVEEHKCGRLNIDHLPSVLSQLGTVQCLQSSADKSSIEPVCMSAISSIELQRGMLELFRVCHNDLSSLCSQVSI